MPAFRNGLSSMAPAILIAGACSPSATAEAQPASVAAPGTPAATTVAPLTVSPPKAADATVVVPNEDSAKGHWGSIWPESAFRGGISGHVVLSCDIDRYGLAERCKVASETPPDQGFGPAALELRPTFKLTPAMGPDGPVDAVMSIAVDFNAPHPQIDFGGAKGGGPAAASSGPMSVGAGADAPDLSGPRLPNRRVSMLDDPVWASTVGYRDVVRVYPARAGGVEGYVVAHCEVNRDGTVSDCHVIKEDPEDRGFGKAALRGSASSPTGRGRPGTPTSGWTSRSVFPRPAPRRRGSSAGPTGWRASIRVRRSRCSRRRRPTRASRPASASRSAGWRGTAR